MRPFFVLYAQAVLAAIFFKVQGQGALELQRGVSS